MSSNNETETDPAVLAARRRNKASRIRTAIAAGKRVSDEAHQFVVEYDREIHGQTEAERASVDPPAPSDPASGTSPPKPSDPPPPDADAPRDPAAQAPLVAATAPPVAPPPPKVKARPVAPPAPPGNAQVVGSDAWLSEFGGGAGGGRRRICVEAAQAWQAIECALAGIIVDGGGRPIVDPASKDRFNLLVLASNELIPKHVTFSPVLEAAGGGTGLMIQAALRMKKARAKREQRVTDRDAAERRAGMGERPVSPAPPVVLEVVREPDNSVRESDKAERVERAGFHAPPMVGKIPEGFRGPLT